LHVFQKGTTGNPLAPLLAFSRAHATPLLVPRNG
jgi:hypothetical protein